MNPKEKRIGWIGLGKMGSPMARRLAEAGYSLNVYNRSKEKTKEFEERGIRVAKSPKEIAGESEIIISMISDDSALESVVLGEDGVLAGIGQGKILMDMSTVSPQISLKVNDVIRKKGAYYLRGPVSGSTKFAASGTLTVFVSGPQNIFEDCNPLLGVLGQKILYMGPGEEARYLKLLVNMMLGTTAMMVAEALTFGEKSGIQWETMLSAIQQSVVASPLIGYKIQPLKDRDFRPAFSVAQIAKDFDVALGAGRALSVPLPMTALVRQFYEGMKATGKGEMDFFGLLLLLEEMAGIKKSG
jgi:3-hydroxyisobutyrate dehydrogenase-like beta-hydroxyacid dehydrogenase